MLIDEYVIGIKERKNIDAVRNGYFVARGNRILPSIYGSLWVLCAYLF